MGVGAGFEHALAVDIASFVERRFCFDDSDKMLTTCTLLKRIDQIDARLPNY